MKTDNHREDFLAVLATHGGPGFEEDTARVIRGVFEQYTREIDTDNLGNLVATVRGSGEGHHPRIMLSAHMDEIALVVTKIEEGGFLRVWQAGGFDPRTLVGQEVVVHGYGKKLHGIIGSKPPHLTTPAEREKAAPLEDLYIDVAMSDEHVREVVSVGDRVTLYRETMELLNQRVSGKALDNRASVAIVFECLRHLKKLRHSADVYAVATAQEEVGVRGATTAAYHINPDIGIAIDVTFAEMPGQPADISYPMNKGPGIAFGPNIHPKVFTRLRDTAETNHIPYFIELSQGPDWHGCTRHPNHARRHRDRLGWHSNSLYAYIGGDRVVRRYHRVRTSIGRVYRVSRHRLCGGTHMLLKKLTEAAGPSGFEDEIRNVIRAEVEPHVDSLYTDVLGSLIAEKGIEQSGPRVLLDAHMDEVGLMIVHIEDNGLLKFRALGGVDPRVLVSKPVQIGADKRYGVIGAKPIHLQSATERTKPLKMEQLYIDIGARDKEDAKKYVKPGDFAVFATRYGEIGDRAAKAKSFDDRVGCGVLIETLKKSYKVPIIGSFAVQEEIGLRGAQAVAHRVRPDIAIALEGTVCFDVVDAPGHGQGTVMGNGPAFTVQDGQTIADRRFLDFLISVAEKNDIPYQLRRVRGGSNDFGVIHKTHEGVVGGGISVPVRYIHAPAQIISLDDYHHTIQLVDAVLHAIADGAWS